MSYNKWCVDLRQLLIKGTKSIVRFANDSSGDGVRILKKIHHLFYLLEDFGLFKGWKYLAYTLILLTRKIRNKIAKVKLLLREEVLSCVSILQTRQNLPHDSQLSSQCSVANFARVCRLYICNAFLNVLNLVLRISLIISTDLFQVCFSVSGIFRYQLM